MSDSVASFPDVPEVQQKLPTAVVPIVTLSSLTAFTGNLRAGSAGSNVHLSTVVTDGFISVTGNTRPFINNFKTLGGHWNKDQSAWKFESKYEGEVNTLVQGINGGKVQPEKFTPYKNKFKKTGEQSIFSTSQTGNGTVGGGISSMLPTLSSPSLDYQVITYSNIYLPRVGMTVSITVGNQTEEFQVIKVGNTGPNVDHALISIKGGKVSELVVMKGHWAVNGMLEQHRVFFKKANKQ